MEFLVVPVLVDDKDEAAHCQWLATSQGKSTQLNRANTNTNTNTNTNKNTNTNESANTNTSGLPPAKERALN